MKGSVPGHRYRRQSSVPASCNHANLVALPAKLTDRVRDHPANGGTSSRDGVCRCGSSELAQELVHSPPGVQRESSQLLS